MLQNNVAPNTGEKLSSNQRPIILVQGSIQLTVASEC